MKEKLINRLEHCLKDLEDNKCKLEQEYKRLGPGTMAFDITLKLEEIKGELKAYKEIQEYIKYIND